MPVVPPIVPVAVGTDPSVPPPPWNMNRPFQFVGNGNCTWKTLWYWHLSNGLMCLLTYPSMMQRAGSVEAGDARTAEVITVFGTGRLAAGRAARAAQDATGVTGVAIDVVVAAKPPHCPCASPS